MYRPCHGLDLRGLGPIPRLAGRSPSYIARQLYDIQHGNRAGSPLKARGRFPCERHQWSGAARRRPKIGFHGGKVEIERPRVRGLDGAERVLPSWENAVSEDSLGKWAMNQMLINVSTRRFKRSVRLPEGDVPASDGAGLSKSAISRRFVALSAARMKAWMETRLDDLDLDWLASGPSILRAEASSRAADVFVRASSPISASCRRHAGNCSQPPSRGRARRATVTFTATSRAS